MAHTFPILLLSVLLSGCALTQKISNRGLATVGAVELTCQKPKSHIFKKKNTHKAFEISLIADQEKLQKRYEEEEEEEGDEKSEALPGLVQFEHKGKKKNLPILVSQRGNSRKDSCTYKPLKVSFLSPEIEEDSKPKAAGIISKEYSSIQYQNIHDLYLEYKNEKPIVKFAPSKQLLKPFKGFGKHLHIVSHCGKSDWKIINEKNQFDQEQALLQEYYLYKIQRILYPLSLSVQLLKINYTSPNGEIVKTALGFARERIQRTAKRCGYREMSESDKFLKTNLNSSYQAKFLFLLFNSYDFGYSSPLSENETVKEEDFGGNTLEIPIEFDTHNLKVVISDKNEKHVVPYDYDLSFVVRNNPKISTEDVDQQDLDWLEVRSTAEKRLALFQSWILKDNIDKETWYSEKDQDPSIRLQRGLKNIKNFLSKKRKVKKLIKKSLLSQKNKDKFNKWVDEYSVELEQTMREIEGRQ